MDNINNKDERKMLVEKYISEKRKNIDIEPEEIKKEKKLVLFKKSFERNKRAGFADVLILSLITGFVGGILTTFVLNIIL